ECAISAMRKLLRICHQPHTFQFPHAFDHDRSRSMAFKYLAANLDILADERREASALILVGHRIRNGHIQDSLVGLNDDGRTESHAFEGALQIKGPCRSPLVLNRARDVAHKTFN